MSLLVSNPVLAKEWGPTSQEAYMLTVVREEVEARCQQVKLEPLEGIGYALDLAKTDDQECVLGATLSVEWKRGRENAGVKGHKLGLEFPSCVLMQGWRSGTETSFRIFCTDEIRSQESRYFSLGMGSGYEIHRHSSEANYLPWVIAAKRLSQEIDACEDIGLNPGSGGITGLSDPYESFFAFPEPDEIGAAFDRYDQGGDISELGDDLAAIHSQAKDQSQGCVFTAMRDYQHDERTLCELKVTEMTEYTHDSEGSLRGWFILCKDVEAPLDALSYVPRYLNPKNVSSGFDITASWSGPGHETFDPLWYYGAPRAKLKEGK